ncbi:DUF742 domain-containing protein [Saccharopolyspora rosea]|uniref:DUF742 domain-containing protein n=1 Tax=Saccharopolyspora rosea TaxID=524884 RepID=A0ABW3FZD6_9PSEU|nr:DUF742 domain-containing protein [Saccharopolyspora rosea]
MSTGPDSSGRHRAAPLASSDVDSLAEVFNRFTLDSARRQRQSTEEPDTATTAQPPEPPWPAAESRSEASSSGTDPSEEHVTATSIRPYAWTGGRTRSNHHLELETLVSTSESCQPGRLRRLEHHSVAELCSHPRSVAEVGALLGVPLGVTKVLLGDMADLGLVTVHRTATEAGSASQMVLMERVLSGLRRL